MGVWPSTVAIGMWLLLGTIVISTLRAVTKIPSDEIIQHNMHHPKVLITIKKGDLFSEHSHLIIGFTDTFDTDSSDGVVISDASVQGQFQKLFYADAIENLDSQLSNTLQDQEIRSRESRTQKRRGKLDRYEIGTVVTLGAPNRRFFCVAYGRMQNNLVVRSSTDGLWVSLSNTWEAVRQHGHLLPVAMPVIGSEMARVSALSRENLLKMILLSFVAHSRQNPVTKSFTVVVHPKDFADINMLEIRAFLRTL
nr:macro domain-containing protein [Streptomyces sp. SID9124]